MMAMNLYGGGSDRNSINPYQSHAYGGKLAQNSVEIQARSLPRPKRKSRRKRAEEKPLFPSVAAVDMVPDAIVSIQEDGRLDIRLCTDGLDMEEELKETLATGMEGDGQEDDNEKKLPALANLIKPVAMRRQSSNPLSSGKLDTAFRGLSLKRKPLDSTPCSADDAHAPLARNHTGPRRKVCRRGSLSDASSDSGGSPGSSSHSFSPSLRRSDSVETSSSSESEGTALGSAPRQITTTPPPSAIGGSSLMGSSLKTTPRSRASNGKTKDPKEIEVQPGVFLPVRGRDETLKAVKNGFVEEIFCHSCDIELLVIANASYCSCPDCNFVTPVDGMAVFNIKSKADGTVGMGLRADDAQW